MSNPLRQKRGNTIVFVILGLVILGLGGFGVTNFSGGVRSIGSVGTEEIDVQDYARALQSEMRRASSQIGQPVTIEIARQLGLDRQVQAQLLAAAALDAEARRVALSAGDEQVRKALFDVPGFQGPDGKFNPQTYRSVLRNEGLTEAEFEARVRKDAVREIIERAAAGGAVAPAPYVGTLAAYVGETRDFMVAELLASDLAEPVAPPDDVAVKAFYDANPKTFTTPEIRRISYVWLSPEALAATVQIDEKDLRAAYDARIDEFVAPERRLVEKLVFPSETEAGAALARIEAGTSTFEDEVKARGLKLEDVDMGEARREDLGSAAEAVFALAEPGVVGPFATDLGPALFAMNGILQGKEVTFDEARPDLETETRLDRARRLVSDKTPAIEDMLASGATLEEVAREAGMEFGTIRYGADATGGLMGYEAFRTAAARIAQDDFPTLAQLDDGGVFALRLDGIDPPALKPLDEVRQEAAAGWTRQETRRQLVALAEEIVAEVAGGGSLAARGLVTTRYSGFLRSGYIDGAPQEIVATAFRTAPGKAAVVDAGDRVHIVQVTAVQPADPAGAEQKRVTDAIAEQARQGLAQDLYAFYAQALEARDGIVLDPGAIEAVHAQIR